MVMIPYDYQKELSKKAYNILKEYGLVYLAMEERTGKSITSILTLEQSELINSVLIVTKKKALEGWQETLSNCSWKKKMYTLTNYHSLSKIGDNNWDAVILDEAHSYLSSYPKRGKIWRDAAKICKDKPIIYMSATPYAQGLQLLYHQLALSSYSLWGKYKNFYSWYEVYAKRDEKGETDTVRIAGGLLRKTYKEIMYDKAMKDVEHLFITKTRASLGFKQEPEDVLHYLTLSDNTRQAYNILNTHRILEFSVGDDSYKLIADNLLKLRTALHMLEGGVLKIDDKYICLNTREKVDYILNKWGDSHNLAIMYNYIAEGDKLREIFKNASIFQGTSFAEGVDLSHIEHLVIYSQDFSVARHTQRRARQANINRTTPIKVHFLLVKNAVSDQVYKSVSLNKKNFVDSLFEQNNI